MDISSYDGGAPDSHVMRPHPVEELVSPALRARLAELDPMLDLDRLVRLIVRERTARPMVDAS